ncbi:TetR/AcrR family transcriptional regulator [Salipaludibacillus sp. HK11]|uniref:TetR/AcrR family transcriptional regulator n=1 Tax=Salipaludibacillus sp. HK11 TaxID=3394320 RepID=UPI0039FDCF52
MNRSDQILTVALEHFADKSYEGASLSGIALQVGIKKASIYNHFNHKEELFLSVAKHVYRLYINEIERTLANHHHLASKEKIFIITETMTDFLSNEEEGKFYMHFLLFPPLHLKDKVHEQFLQFEHECDQLLSPIFEEIASTYEISHLSLRDLLDAFYCLLDGITSQMFYYHPDIALRKRQTSLALFWTGVINTD